MQFRGFVVLCITLLFLTLPAAAQNDTSSEGEIPPPVEMIDEGTDEIVNYLLLGSDTFNAQNSGRTDVIIIVSLNYTAGTAALLSIPRDLYVYIPGVQRYRINTAFASGEQQEQGGGAALLSATIAYNLGIHIDGYARVDFNEFRELVNALGGIEVAVDCGIQDWRLNEPGLDPSVENNWSLFTLPIGMHNLDGDLALWYARSRRTSSDYDRGRRHQVILRAMLHRLRGLGLLSQVTVLWPQVTEWVETDITLDAFARMAPFALTLTPDRIASYTFTPEQEVRASRAPDGAWVAIPQPDLLRETIIEFLTPPTTLQIGRERPRVEIINASGIEGLDRIAAERLAWDGFTVVIGSPSDRYRETTVLEDLSGERKGSSLALLQSILRVDDSFIEVAPQAGRSVDFRATIGGAYYACTYPVLPPEIIEEQAVG